MGAVAISNLRTGVTHDGRRFKEATVTFSNSYAAGGDTVPLAALGLGEVRRIEVLDPGASGYVIKGVTTDPKAPKIQAQRRNDAAAVVEPTGDISGVATGIRVRFIGS